MATVETTVRAIEANAAAWKTQAASIQGDGNLTAFARRQQLGAAYDAAFDRHSKLFNEMLLTVEQQRAGLNEALLSGGRAGEEMSERDALDRARQAKEKGSKELAELVRDASLTADKPMLRAASYTAARESWWGVVGAAADAGFAPAAKLLDFEQVYGVLRTTDALFRFKVRTTGPARLAGM